MLSCSNDHGTLGPPSPSSPRPPAPAAEAQVATSLRTCSATKIGTLFATPRAMASLGRLSISNGPPVLADDQLGEEGVILEIVDQETFQFAVEFFDDGRKKFVGLRPGRSLALEAAVDGEGLGGTDDDGETAFSVDLLEVDDLLVGGFGDDDSLEFDLYGHEALHALGHHWLHTADPSVAERRVAAVLTGVEDTIRVARSGL